MLLTLQLFSQGKRLLVGVFCTIQLVHFKENRSFKVEAEGVFLILSLLLAASVQCGTDIVQSAGVVVLSPARVSTVVERYIVKTGGMCPSTPRQHETSNQKAIS